MMAKPRRDSGWSCSIALALLSCASSMNTAAQPAHSPSSIAEAVQQELEQDDLVELDEVEATAREGVVTLNGEVQSLLAKERAASLAETVGGVDGVDNRLRVKARPWKNTYDLESAIRQALLKNPATESFNVVARAGPAGDVTLTGRAQSRAEKELVGRVAKSVAGVTSVDNRVSVDPPSLRSDSQVAAEVEQLLRWDAYVGDRAIEVSVQQGVVSLSGHLRSAAEKRRAGSIAEMAGGRGVDLGSLHVAPSP